MLFIFLDLVIVVFLTIFVACGKEQISSETPEEWQCLDRLLLVTLTATSPNDGTLVA